MFTPSKYQENVFKWFEDPSGHICISAVAGSGKTSTLVEGTKLLAPDKQGSTMFAAFNNAIVQELKSRLPRHVNCQTLHSLGYQTLRDNFSDVKRWDLEEGKNKYRMMARDVQVSSAYGDPRVVRDALTSMVNYAQLTLTPLEVGPLAQMADRFNIELPPLVPVEELAVTVKKMLERGIEQTQQGFIAFPDMLYVPAFLGLRPRQFGMIAVDEAQDLSKVQMTLLTRSLEGGANLVAVGDRAQAIYMFAGAEPDSFDQMRNHFGAEELPLSICYRCPTSVIKEAQEIVPGIEAAPNAPEGVVAHISDETFKDVLNPGDMVVCRVTAPLMKLCFELIARRIPATVKGRDIGAKMANTIRIIMKRSQDVRAFPRFAAEWLETMLDTLRAKLGTEEQQESVADQHAALTLCYTMFQPYSVESFCKEVSNLFSDQASPVTLCTVHRAKGLECDRVFILRPEKMPLVWKNQKPAQYDQEMNLRYVAITRAKRELYYVDGPQTAPATGNANLFDEEDDE